MKIDKHQWNIRVTLPYDEARRLGKALTVLATEHKEYSRDPELLRLAYELTGKGSAKDFKTMVISL